MPRCGRSLASGPWGRRRGAGHTSGTSKLAGRARATSATPAAADPAHTHSGSTTVRCSPGLARASSQVSAGRRARSTGETAPLGWERRRKRAGGFGSRLGLAGPRVASRRKRAAESTAFRGPRRVERDSLGLTFAPHSAPVGPLLAASPAHGRKPREVRRSAGSAAPARPCWRHYGWRWRRDRAGRPCHRHHRRSAHRSGAALRRRNAGRRRLLRAGAIPGPLAMSAAASRCRSHTTHTRFFLVPLA